MTMEQHLRPSLYKNGSQLNYQEQTNHEIFLVKNINWIKKQPKTDTENCFEHFHEL
jgi:hypothetical protein